MTSVTLVDLDYGNLGSIATALCRLGADVERSSDPAVIAGAERLILPSLQVNIRAGQLPAPDDNGVRYLRIPLNALPGPRRD